MEKKNLGKMERKKWRGAESHVSNKYWKIVT